MSRSFKPYKKSDNAFDFTTPLPTEKPVAVYYRQSTFAQVGNISTAIQTIDMVSDLAKRGWKPENIILIDMDEGVSGTKKIEERDGMRRLFQLISDGTIGAVACQDEDRLFRDVTQIQVNIFIEACRTAQVQVITPSVIYVFHHPVQGDFYRRQFRYKSEMAADYINTVIIGKLNRARNRLMEEGKWGGTRIPIGYMVDMREQFEGTPNPNYRKFVVFEPLAKIVREYFRIFIETNGSIVKTYERIFDLGLFYPSLEEYPIPNGFQVNYHLTNSRVPTRPAIGLMMSHPVYIGHWMFRGEVIIWNNHEPLLNEKVFFEAFNLVSRYTLDGEENTNYQKVKEYPKPSRENARNAPRPVYEGLLWLYIDREWKKLGAWYDRPREVYVYHTNEQTYNPSYTIWQRSSTAIDEAITHRLHQKIRATFDSEVWRETTANQLAEAEAEKKRLQSQVEALERAMTDVVNNLASLKHPTLIAQLEHRYARMEEERLHILQQIVDVERANQLVYQSAFAEMHSALENWRLLSRDEQRKIALILIQRIEIPQVTPHRELTMRIIWFDNSVDEFTVRRTVAQKDLWTLEELDTLYQLVEAGATQLEIAQALPTRKWLNIRRQILRRFGSGVRIPDVGVLQQQESAESYMHRVGGTQSNSTPS